MKEGENELVQQLESTCYREREGKKEKRMMFTPSGVL